MKRIICRIYFRPCWLEDLSQNLIAKKTKTPVMIIAIGIREVLFGAMSASEEVNILKVSWIAPKLSSENNIANPFHLFISVCQF